MHISFIFLKKFLVFFLEVVLFWPIREGYRPIPIISIRVINQTILL